MAAGAASLPALRPLAQAHATLRLAAPSSVEALSHVADLVSACLDRSPQISLRRAAASGCARLFTRVAHHLVGAEISPLVREYAFAVSLETALQADDVAMAETIHGLHPGPLAVEALTLAMAHGSLELVQWVLTHRHDRRCCAEHAANLCQPCAEGAMYWLQDRDTFRIASWILSRVLLVDSVNHNPSYLGLVKLTTSHSELFKVARGAIRQSPELVRWLDATGFLTKTMIDELVTNTLRRETGHRPSEETVHYFLERGYALDSQEQMVDFLVRFSCHRGDDERVERLLASAACASIRHEFTYAAFRPGGAKVLQWSQEFDKTREGACLRTLATMAISAGNADMLEYLVHAHGVREVMMPYMDAVPEDDWITFATILHDADALERPLISAFCSMENALRYGQLRVVQWLHERGRCGDTDSAMDTCAEYGHLHIIKWLHVNRPQSCTSIALNDAAARGHLDVQWLVENRTEGDVNVAMAYAAAHGRLDVLMWLHRHGADACVSCVRSTLLSNVPAYATEVYTYPTRAEVYAVHALYTLRWLDQHSDSAAVGCAGNCTDSDGIYSRARGSLVMMAVQAGDVALLEYLDEHHRELFVWRGYELEGAMKDMLNPDCFRAIQWLYVRYPKCCDWRQLADIAKEKESVHLSEWARSKALWTEY